MDGSTIGSVRPLVDGVDGSKLLSLSKARAHLLAVDAVFGRLDREAC